jgi:hypothetical protein
LSLRGQPGGHPFAALTEQDLLAAVAVQAFSSLLILPPPDGTEPEQMSNGRQKRARSGAKGQQQLDQVS